MRFLATSSFALKLWLLMALAMTNFAAFASCEDAVTNHPGLVAFEHYNRKVAHEFFRLGLKNLISETRQEEFWFETWPAIRAYAEQNETSVREMFEEAIAFMSLYHSTIKGDRALDAAMDAMLKNLPNNLTGLENLKMGGKFKANHRTRVIHVMWGMYILANMAFQTENFRLNAPTFDPTAKLSLNMITKILDSLDDSAIDGIAMAAETVSEYEADIKAMDERNRARLAQQIFASESPSTSTTAQPELIPAPVITTSPILTDQLAIALKEKTPLNDSIQYKAKTASGDDFEVQMSASIVRADKNGERETLRRLLKSIFHGTRGKTGIKPLFDIGPQIVEIKARMKGGHKRIIGCMEGRSLRLIALMEMPDTRAGYFKMIPANLCRASQ